MSASIDFWQTSGFHLLDRDEAGRLKVTPDYLRAYFMRPEIAPVKESCKAERKLHKSLLDDPTRSVGENDLAEMADPDARENYQIVLRFRDLLVEQETVEGAYLHLFREGGVALPGLFLDQMTHVVLRNILDGSADPIRVRAAELLFRTQMVTIKEGAIMVADEEIVEMRAARDDVSGVVHFDHIGQLLTQSQPSGRTVELDILDEKNASEYWGRSDRFDTVLDIGFTKPGLDALCRMLESWVRHFLDVEVRIYPVQSIRDDRWVWHIGLDAEATIFLNTLYEGKELTNEQHYRLLSLFRMEFKDPTVTLPQVQGRPIYMAMGMTRSNKLKLKPQNLLSNLPIPGFI